MDSRTQAYLRPENEMVSPLSALLSPLVLASNLAKIGGSNVLTGIRNAFGGDGNYAVPSDLSALAGLSRGSGISNMATGDTFAGDGVLEGLMRDAAQNRGADYGQFMQAHPTAHGFMDVFADPLAAMGGAAGMVKGRALSRLANTALAGRAETLADKVARLAMTGAGELPQAGRGVAGITDPIRKIADRESGIGNFLWDTVTFNPGTRSYFDKGGYMGRDLLNPMNANNVADELNLYGRGALQAPKYTPNHTGDYDGYDKTLETYSQQPGVKQVRRISDGIWEAEMHDGTRQQGQFRKRLTLAEDNPSLAASEGDALIHGYADQVGPNQFEMMFTGDALKTTPKHEYAHTLYKSNRFTPEEMDGLRKEYFRSGASESPEYKDRFEEWVADGYEQYQYGSGNGIRSRVSDLASSIFSNEGLPVARQTFRRINEGETAARPVGTTTAARDLAGAESELGALRPAYSLGKSVLDRDVIRQKIEDKKIMDDMEKSRLKLDVRSRLSLGKALVTPEVEKRAMFNYMAQNPKSYSLGPVDRKVARLADDAYQANPSRDNGVRLIENWMYHAMAEDPAGAKEMLGAEVKLPSREFASPAVSQTQIIAEKYGVKVKDKRDQLKKLHSMVLDAARGPSVRDILDERGQGHLIGEITGSAAYDPLTGRLTVHPGLEPERAAVAASEAKKIKRDLSWKDKKVELPAEDGTLHPPVNAGEQARLLTNRVTTLRRLQECLG
jgi:hypothetical protein